MADNLERLALAMRAQALIHRERGRHNRAKELEAFAFAVETAAALDSATFAPMPFAVMCHTMAGRALAVRHSGNPALRGSDLVSLSRLAAYATEVGDEADAAPELFKESQP
ncbi:hypothetical protein Bhz60_00004 [Stenotrophomonas phage vB_SmaS_Bhz60]